MILARGCHPQMLHSHVCAQSVKKKTKNILLLIVCRNASSCAITPTCRSDRHASVCTYRSFVQLFELPASLSILTKAGLPSRQSGQLSQTSRLIVCQLVCANIVEHFRDAASFQVFLSGCRSDVSVISP